MSEDPNYIVMELQNANEGLKDALIKRQNDLIDKLQEEIVYLKSLINWRKDETDVGSHAIAPPVQGLKPRVRTVSEVQVLLERRSANAANAFKSIEEVKNAE